MALVIASEGIKSSGVGSLRWAAYGVGTVSRFAETFAADMVDPTRVGGIIEEPHTNLSLVTKVFERRVAVLRGVLPDTIRDQIDKAAQEFSRAVSSVRDVTPCQNAVDSTHLVTDLTCICASVRGVIELGLHDLGPLVNWFGLGDALGRSMGFVREDARDDEQPTLLPVLEAVAALRYRERGLVPELVRLFDWRCGDEPTHHVSLLCRVLGQKNPKAERRHTSLYLHRWLWPLHETIDDCLAARSDEDLVDAYARTPKRTLNGKTRAFVPENRDVLKLARKIKRARYTRATKVEIARDFTDGDEKRAQSLLRKLRDFPHLLD